MPLLRLEKASLAFGHRPLLEQVNMDVRSGERVCLLGRNGEGKSSLLHLFTGQIQPDSGIAWIRPGTRVAYLAQEVAVDSTDEVFDIVAGGLPGVGKLLTDYHHAAAELAHTDNPATARRLADLQHQIDSANGWQLELTVNTVLTRLSLDGTAKMQELSGGRRRRVMLARALVSDPQVLLLDEPTNHLDIEAITWLEDFIAEYRGALLFISHDRAFVRRLATRIVELDRGRLTSWPGNYDAYVLAKKEALAVEAKHNAEFDKKLAEEEVWIRKGIEARRTRNEGRVRALYALRDERRQRRERAGKVEMQLQETEQSGKLVFEAEHAALSFGDRAVIKDFSVRIMRGDRIGIIGPNGAGKTTLIKLLLGDLPPTSGKVKQGTKIQVAYFDQQRQQLNLEASVMANVGGTGDTVTINGQPRHISGYLRDFLFPPERLLSPVKMLSGGERNRLLLARLFAQPANLLVLDEPTNDLDVETLDLLEELIAGFDGTMLLVSHDRAFLDNVVTSTLVFEGDGRVVEYVGGYTDWVRQRGPASGSAQGKKAAAAAAAAAAMATAKPATPEKPAAKKVKLSYKDQRELEMLPEKIQRLEAEQATLTATIGGAAFYQKPHAEVSAALARMEALTAELETAFARWEALDLQSQG